ncbi:MAG: hypothetical protein ACE1Y2_07850 [Stenotrophomonas maltophilia]
MTDYSGQDDRSSGDTCQTITELSIDGPADEVASHVTQGHGKEGSQ